MKIEFPLFEKGVLSYVFLGNFKKENLHYKGEGVDIAFLYEKYIADNNVNYIGVTILIYLEFASEPIEIKFGIAEEVISVIGDVGLEGIYKDMVGYVYTFYYQKVLGLSLFNTRNSGYLDSIILRTWLMRSIYAGSQWFDYFFNIPRLSYRVCIGVNYRLLFLALDTGDVLIKLQVDPYITENDLSIMVDEGEGLIAFNNSIEGRTTRVSGDDYIGITTKIYDWLLRLSDQDGIPYEELIL